MALEHPTRPQFGAIVRAALTATGRNVGFFAFAAVSQYIPLLASLVVIVSSGPWGATLAGGDPFSDRARFWGNVFENGAGPLVFLAFLAWRAYLTAGCLRRAAATLMPSAPAASTLARTPAVLGVMFLMGLLAVLGALAFVAPILLPMMRFGVALPTCAIEGLGPFASLRRSWHMTGRAPAPAIGVLALRLALSAPLIVVLALAFIALTTQYWEAGFLSGFVVGTVMVRVAPFTLMLMTALYRDLAAAEAGVPAR